MPVPTMLVLATTSTLALPLHVASASLALPLNVATTPAVPDMPVPTMLVLATTSTIPDLHHLEAAPAPRHLHCLHNLLDLPLDSTPALHVPYPALSFDCLFHFLLESSPAALHFLGHFLPPILELSPALAVHLLHLLEAAPAPLQSPLQLIFGWILKRPQPLFG